MVCSPSSIQTGFSRFKLGTQIQHLIRQAVRARANGQCHNLGMTDGGAEQCFQVRERRVGVGVGLEVGNVGIRRGAILPLMREMASSIWLLTAVVIEISASSGRGKIPGPAFTAKDTAARPQGSVPVGACHPPVQGNLVDLLPEAGFQFKVQGVIRFAVPVHMCVSFPVREYRIPFPFSIP